MKIETGRGSKETKQRCWKASRLKNRKGERKTKREFTKDFLNVSVYVCATSLQSCPTFCDPMDCSPPRLLCPWDSPGKNTGVGCHFLPGDLPHSGMELRSPTLQADAVTSVPPGKPLRMNKQNRK